MKTPARMRESLLLDYIFRYHPGFSSRPEGSTEKADRLESASRRYWYSRGDIDPLEGGDILVLSAEVVAVGCSDRTSTEAIERLSGRLLAGGYREVLVIRLPFTRAFMHLDTVFTMVDRDAFTIFPGIKDRLEIYRLRRAARERYRGAGDRELHEETGVDLHVEPIDSLQRALKESLKLSAVRLIESGGGDLITAAREQWNDSTNTLALAPGKVVTYDRNVASNTTLRRNGVEVVEIEGSELVRGRGGPRCMSMPLKRRPLE
jgi:arginine deiminase